MNRLSPQNGSQFSFEIVFRTDSGLNKQQTQVQKNRREPNMIYELMRGENKRKSR